MDIKSIAQKIFYKPAQSPSSIQLVLDGATIKDIFDTLLQFFIHGMKIKYGNSQGKVDLSKLSLKSFNTIKEYINSIGFEIFFTVVEKNKKSNNDNCKELKDFTFHLNGTKDTVYEIHFDYYTRTDTCSE